MDFNACKEKLQQATRWITAHSPGMAGILLWIPHVVTEEDTVAYTNGNRAFFGKKFFEGLNDKERAGVVAHEALHVALRHVSRSKRLMLSEDNYNPMVFNVAADILVNHAIQGTPFLTLPKDCCFAENFIDRQTLSNKPIQNWRVEEVYRYLMKNTKTINITVQSMGGTGEDLKGGASDGDGDADGNQPGGGPKKMVLNDPSQNNPFGQDANNEEMQERLWENRLERAAAGDRPNGMMRKIQGDIPKSRVAWEKVLRRFVIARVMPFTEESWNRPSRRTLAMGCGTHYIEAGIERQKGVRRVGVVIDTSGSIGQKQLDIFFREINTIMEKTHCEVVLVDCDAAVHQVKVYREQVPMSYTPKGGGGTDFRPAFEELKKHPIDCMVYLTDLCGAFPKKCPPYPVLWAATMDLEIPFGHKVMIPASNEW